LFHITAPIIIIIRTVIFRMVHPIAIGMFIIMVITTDIVTDTIMHIIKVTTMASMMVFPTDLIRPGIIPVITEITLIKTITI